MRHWRAGIKNKSPLQTNPFLTLLYNSKPQTPNQEMPFQLQSPYSPAGDQPEAIQQLTENINNGEQFQTLLGVTGYGKCFTRAGYPQ